MEALGLPHAKGHRVWYPRSRVVACVFTTENQDPRWAIDAEPPL